MKYLLATLFVVIFMWFASADKTCQWTLTPRTPVGTVLSANMMINRTECCQGTERHTQKCNCFNFNKITTPAMEPKYKLNSKLIVNSRMSQGWTMHGLSVVIGIRRPTNSILWYLFSHGIWECLLISFMYSWCYAEQSCILTSLSNLYERIATLLL